ncbi:gp10 [Burkholderia phage Bcep43]|uniref:Gp10 n=1 Tax=Burkholderia phage Bcep43 TaxID=2883945 RepID=Q6UKE2_9CAUD|nr:gp10 [Burkholderia phage Bcep43]AAR89300.1 gp10 [Burkholderia phage Bcep43]
MLIDKHVNYELYWGDCLDLMRLLPDASVDMVMCDLPYGTTACAWDSVLPFDALWAQYRRIVKSRGAVVLTAAQPFTSALVASNFEWFKYDWVWAKNRPTNFAHAKNKPMPKHESVLVFSPGTTVHASQFKLRMTYNPQGLTRIEPRKMKTYNTDAMFSKRGSHGEYTQEFTNYPHSLLEFSTDQLNLHPTAKPVALMEYLIRTYTSEGDTVLDNCMGSGTTGVACINTGRRFIGMEKDADYALIATGRMREAIDRDIPIDLC